MRAAKSRVCNSQFQEMEFETKSFYPKPDFCIDFQFLMCVLGPKSSDPGGGWCDERRGDDETAAECVRVSGLRVKQLAHLKKL